MDYSQLSDQDLLALKSKDYSKLSDKALLALKGETSPSRTDRRDPIQQAQNLQFNTSVVSPISPTPLPPEAGNIQRSDEFQTGNAIGQQVAEQMGAAGHPMLGALAGTGIGMVAPVANAGYTTTMMGGPEGIANTLSAIGRGGVQGLKNLGSRIVTGKNTEQIAGLRGEIANLASQKAAKEAALEGLRANAGSDIEAARNAAGIPQKISGLPQVGQDTNETAQFFKDKIGSMDPEKLAEVYGKDGLAQLRDVAQSTKEAGVNATQNAFINRGVAKIDKALETLAPDVSKSYAKYGEVMQAQEALPQEFLDKKTALLNQIRNLQPAAKTEQALRKMTLGGAGSAGGVGALLYALHKLGMTGR